MTPTGRLLFLAATWAALGVVVSWQPVTEPAWWMFLAAAAAVAAADAGLAWRAGRGLSYERKLPGRFAVGERVGVTVVLANGSGKALRLELFDGIPEGTASEELPWAGEVPAGAKIAVTYHLELNERGPVRFRAAHARVLSPLGFWKKSVKLGGEQEARVFPDYEPVVRFALLAMEARQEQMGIVRRARSGSSREFQQLRPYQEGDSLARIDWKASSRRLELISREYEEQRDQTIIFMIDTGRRMRALDGDLPQIDHCLNAVLLLSYVALKQGDRVGVLSIGGKGRWLPPVKGAHSMATVLNHLYDYQTSPEPSDFVEAAERLQIRQRRRALIVLLTNLRGEDGAALLPALRSLSARHLVMLASLRERTVEDARHQAIDQFSQALTFSAAERYHAERGEVLAALKSRGVLTLDVPAGDLPVALANRYLEIKAAGRL